MKTVVSGTSASRSPSAYMTMITAMMTQVPHAVCIRFIQKSLCIHFPFPKFKSFPSSKIHGLFNSSFSSSKIHSFANHHFLNPIFTVYSKHHCLHPKFTVYSNHHLILPKFMVIQIIIFFIRNSQFIQTIISLSKIQVYNILSLSCTFISVNLYFYAACVRRRSCIL